MWTTIDYQFAPDESSPSPSRDIERLFDAVWRTDFATPGFAVLDLGPNLDSHDLRALMLQLKDQFDAVGERRSGVRFAYRSLGRFDQQVTTRFHRDGAPDQSLLMLGYEPSAVPSRLTLADYTRCAHDLGIEPDRFLDEFNPMYRQGKEKLAHYRTELPPGPSHHSRVVLINNSALPFSVARTNPLGVLHQAEIPQPDASRRRVINSIMLRVGDSEEIDPGSLEHFVATDEISGQVFG